jgi:hypothetical protein
MLARGVACLATPQAGGKLGLSHVKILRSFERAADVNLTEGAQHSTKSAPQLAAVSTSSCAVVSTHIAIRFLLPPQTAYVFEPRFHYNSHSVFF